MRVSTLFAVIGFFVFEKLVPVMADDVTAGEDQLCATSQGPADMRVSAGAKLIERTTDNQKLADLYNNRGAAFARKGDQDRALADYTRAIDLDSGTSAPYVNRGGLFYRRGELDRAIEDFAIALRLQPAFERAYMGRTLALLKKDDAQGALHSVDDMISHLPTSAVAVETRAYVLKAIGRLNEAIAEYRKALQMASRLPAAATRDRGGFNDLGAIL